MVQRRAFLGLIFSLPLWGATWVRGAWAASISFLGRNQEAFTLKGEKEVFEALGFPGGVPKVSALIELQAPEIAENGAVVPIEVLSRLPDSRRLLLLVQKNPNTLAADHQFSSRTLPRLGLRLKFAETSEIAACVQTPEGWFVARKTVKVTVGGCGG